MGDRANVFITPHHGGLKDGKSGVYLYTHWGGYDLPFVIQKTLSSLVGKSRWDDAPYLARIIFCSMIKGNIDGATGFGISDELGDNERLLIEINTAEQKVKFLIPPNAHHSSAWLATMPETIWSFDAYSTECTRIIYERWRGQTVEDAIYG